MEDYHPIICLPVMWKLLIGIITEEIYTYLERENLISEEQKGCQHGSRGTKDHLLIDRLYLFLEFLRERRFRKGVVLNLQTRWWLASPYNLQTVSRDCRKRHTNLAMSWIDYKKAYNFVPHSWICECMETFGVAENARTFLERNINP